MSGQSNIGIILYQIHHQHLVCILLGRVGLCAVLIEACGVVCTTSFGQGGNECSWEISAGVSASF